MIKIIKTYIFHKASLISFCSFIPTKLFADYSGRHYNSSSADLLLIIAFIVVIGIAIILYFSENKKRKIDQAKDVVTSKQNYNYTPKVDIRKSTIAIISASSLEKQAKYSSYLRSFQSGFSSLSESEKDRVWKILNKGACDAAKEYVDHLESDSEIDFKPFFYSSKEHEEFVKNEKKRKRHFYDPPLEYSVYYDLAYDTVMSDITIRYRIKHYIETGLIVY